MPFFEQTEQRLVQNVLAEKEVGRSLSIGAGKSTTACGVPKLLGISLCSAHSYCKPGGPALSPALSSFFM